MDQFIGQIRQYAFNYAPLQMALCNGQSIAITQNQSLYALLGTQFGGDGQTTFDLPHLRGRTPVGVGAAYSNATPYSQGDLGGWESITLTVNETGHTHSVMANNTPADSGIATGHLLAYADKPQGGEPVSAYTDDVSTLTQIGAGAISSVGGAQAHANLQPSLVISFAIALEGVFPPRN